MGPPQRFADPQACAEAIVERLSGSIRLAAPLGLGKPALLINALYRQARQRPEISLTIYTALSLEIPRAGSELEGRLLGPLAERLYGRVPELEYAADQRRGTLPDNVRVCEFYFRPGASLGVAAAQQNYISSNYTHVARDLAAHGVNVIAQMLAPPPAGGSGRYSLSCNPDLTFDLIDALASRNGAPPLLAGEVNRALPYMTGDGAEVDAGDLDLLLESEETHYDLFPVPNRPVSLAEQIIGLRVAALMRDGGTLQIGIGSLSDAVAHAIALRHTRNAGFRDLVRALDIPAGEAELDDLPRGLYGASEMFVEGFLHLREQGVLRRTVDGGVYLHGGFFLGSAGFYEQLRRMPETERQGIRMTRISFTNSLHGDEQAKRTQRTHARFVNTVMMVTLLGSAVSDALEDGRVVSGVGGQYNFVAMAHELEGGRSILVLPATRTSKGTVTSNIVWRYGHVTIPRHLRDVVVTEYGVADLRGATDQDVVAALLNLADSRFQEDLRRQAVEAGKLPDGYRIPRRFRNNRPGPLTRRLEEDGLLAALPWYPLGTDLTPVEAELAVALASLAEKRGSWRRLLREAWDGMPLVGQTRLQPALARLGLARPRTIRERLYRMLVAAALVREVHGNPRPLLPLGKEPREAESDPEARRRTP